MSNRRMQAAYDQAAEAFARLNPDMPPELAPLGAKLLAIGGPAARILDVGCGPGQHIAWLESHGARCVGVDLSPAMLRLARRRVQAPLVQMDMRRLAFAAETFTGIWACAALLHLPKADAAPALAEMRRVPAPGGALALIIQEGDGEGWEWTAPDGPLGRVERFFARYRAPEAQRMLAAAGFRVLEHDQGRHAGRNWLRFLARAGP